MSEADRFWLHDKYERLAAAESDLIATRTSYFATIGAVLITGLVFALANLLREPLLLSVSVTFLAVIGIVLSVVWWILLHRTSDAQNLWREAALRLEELSPPLNGRLPAPVTLRSGDRLEVDLLRPYHAHAQRFADRAPISWMDRLNPTTIAEVLPMTFIGIWSVVLVAIWTWFFLHG